MVKTVAEDFRRVEEEALSNVYEYAFNMQSLKEIQNLCTLTNERVNLRLKYYPHIGIQVLCTDLDTLEVNYYVTDPTPRLDKLVSIYNEQVVLKIKRNLVPDKYRFVEIANQVKDAIVHTPRDTPQVSVLVLMWYTEWMKMVQTHINPYPKTQTEREGGDE